MNMLGQLSSYYIYFLNFKRVDGSANTKTTNEIKQQMILSILHLTFAEMMITGELHVSTEKQRGCETHN